MVASNELTPPRQRRDWPLVAPDDPGLRPTAGKPDECFYCNRKIGSPHGPSCVVVKKRVKVRYTFELEIDVPHDWSGDSVERHHNDSSWCADNAVNDIESYIESLNGGCICNH